MWYITQSEDGYSHTIWANNWVHAFKIVRLRNLNEEIQGPLPIDHPSPHLDERLMTDKEIYANIPKMLHQTIYAYRLALKSATQCPEWLLRETSPLHELIHMLNEVYDKESELGHIRKNLTELFNSIPGFRQPNL